MRSQASGNDGFMRNEIGQKLLSLDDFIDFIGMFQEDRGLGQDILTIFCCGDPDKLNYFDQLVACLAQAAKGDDLEMAKADIERIRQEYLDKNRISSADFVETAEPYIENHKDIRRLEKAFRDDPDRVIAFIDTLPEPDMTIVGFYDDDNDLNDAVVCFKCATDDKRAALHDSMTPVYRDDTEEEEYVCVRCGQVLDVEFSPPEPVKPATGTIPDFRSVERDSESEDELQRVFEVMIERGPQWEALQNYIAFCWNSMMREKHRLGPDNCILPRNN